jgi:hypothetical protein
MVIRPAPGTAPATTPQAVHRPTARSGDAGVRATTAPAPCAKEPDDVHRRPNCRAASAAALRDR